MISDVQCVFIMFASVMIATAQPTVPPISLQHVYKTKDECKQPLYLP